MDLGEWGGVEVWGMERKEHAVGMFCMREYKYKERKKKELISEKNRWCLQFSFLFMICLVLGLCFLSDSVDRCTVSGAPGDHSKLLSI